MLERVPAPAAQNRRARAKAACRGTGPRSAGIRPAPSVQAGAYMDLESASLLLMSTSRSLSFALMCLYSVYSSAMGMRSSFWTFLMETEERGLSAVFCL